MAHLELEAEVGAGNHVIKHTHAERSQRDREGEKNCKFVPQKKRRRETFEDKEGAEGDQGGVEEDARNYQGALCARAGREGKPLKEGQVLKAHLWALCLSSTYALSPRTVLSTLVLSYM